MLPKDEGQRLSRRKALKLASSATAASAIGTGVVTATEAQTEYVGVSYDPFNHKTQGPVSARLEENSKGVTGTLNVGGFQIPVGEEQRLPPVNRGEPNQQYITVKHDDEFTRKERSLKIDFTNYGADVAGNLTRRGPEFGLLGFTLVPADEMSQSDVRSLLPNDGRGVEHRPDKPMPSSGIPGRFGPGDVL